MQQRATGVMPCIACGRKARFFCGHLCASNVVYCGEACAAQHWATRHKLQCIGGNGDKKRARDDSDEEIIYDGTVVLKSNDGRTFTLPKDVALKSVTIANIYSEKKAKYDVFPLSRNFVWKGHEIVKDEHDAIEFEKYNGILLGYIVDLLLEKSPKVPNNVSYDDAFECMHWLELDRSLLKRALSHFPGQSMAYAVLTADKKQPLHYKHNWLQYELPVWDWDTMARVVLLIKEPDNEKKEYIKRQFERVLEYDDFLNYRSEILLDPSARYNDAIKLAAQNGHADVVRMLLADPRVNPAAQDNYAIRWAAEKGHVEVVRMLLANPRVDPAANDNEAIRWAARQGHVEVVRMLLDTPDRGIDPAAKDNYAIRQAAFFGQAEVVRMLLDTPGRGIDPAALDNEAIRWAERNDYAEVVRMLLADPRVDPTAKNNLAIRWAAQQGHADVVHLLLTDPRVDPTAYDNHAIQLAALKGYADVVRMLLADPRVATTLSPQRLREYTERFT